MNMQQPESGKNRGHLFLVFVPVYLVRPPPFLPFFLFLLLLLSLLFPLSTPDRAEN